MADFRMFNVVILGIGFMLIFTAFTTCGNIEQTVIKSLSNSTFQGSGYNSLAIIYGVFSASNLIAPSVVASIGPRLSMIFSGLLYSGYIAVFIIPATWSFYLTSVLIGVGAAVLWTAQGNFLVLNSDANTINRNTGLFWALLQCSMLFGNLYIYLDWNGITAVTDTDRRTLFIVLLVLSLLGTMSFVVLRKTGDREEPLNEEDSLLPACVAYVTQSSTNQRKLHVPAWMTMLKLFGTKTILLLSFCMAYSGLELTFYSGVYGTCIGATTQFGAAAKGLIGLSGILVGIGEIVGGGLFGLLCKNNRFRRTSVVFLGMVVHFIAFYLIFLNIPDDAPVVVETGTRSKSYLTPSVPVALLCSFLLGLGDSCFNTQLYSILGCLYAEESAPVFAIFKFIQSICAAVAFLYSNYLLLSWQLLVMVIFGFTGTLCFFLVEKMNDLLLGLPEY
ncbi:UNC93-like protein MFSD11 isoform X3 [Acipenser ruthenus]|uniref:UNC93-like protein MFSD11 isoform X3 n=1 Tax=Acipenser ruthenus TaxID=7906 RepID=UPI00145AE9C5|nr:UNC93-like protein MFSD11 isoform X3 [Acipenser ruthenus]